MKTLREFAEDMLNQVTAATGYQGKIVEKIENNEKITVCSGVAAILEIARNIGADRPDVGVCI